MLVSGLSWSKRKKRIKTLTKSCHVTDKPFTLVSLASHLFLHVRISHVHAHTWNNIHLCSSSFHNLQNILVQCILCIYTFREQYRSVDVSCACEELWGVVVDNWSMPSSLILFHEVHLNT